MSTSGATLITAEHMTLTECQIALWIVLRKHCKGKSYISREEWDKAIGQRLEVGEYASGNVFVAALDKGEIA